MNEVLIDIYLSDSENCSFSHNRKKIFEFFHDSQIIFDNYFYPYIEKLNQEKRLPELIEKLTDAQKKALSQIPNELISTQTINVEVIKDEDGSNFTLETNCFNRIVKPYKHPVFFELLALLLINNTFSAVKENHAFGYHFHLLKGRNGKRTATLLTFNKNEKPFDKKDSKYNTFPHTLYYEPHSEGAASKPYEDINSKAKSFRTKLYDVCKKTLVDNIEKSNFKEPSKKSKIVTFS